MKIWLQFLAIGGCILGAGAAHAAHGIALWGDLKYKENFKHFEYVNPDAPKGGALKLSYSASFDSMNPFILKGVAAPGVSSFVYQSLMTASYDEPQSYYPLIANSITVAPDRSYADFTLNQAARWQDGTPITPEDVVWTLNILKEKGHPSLKVQFKPITAEARGEHAVRFYFADKEHRELPLIAASMPVLPKHGFCEGVVRVESRESSDVNSTADEHSTTSKGDAASTRLSTLDSGHSCIPFDKTTLTPPLGSGPYKVTALEPGRSVTLTRVKDYWAEKLPTQIGFNNFDTIRYDVYRDDTVALEGLKSHQFDFYEEFIARNWATAYDIPTVKSGELTKIKINHKIPRGMQGFMFNTRLPKFSDRRVRAAIGLTLDFEWMNKTLFYDAYERGKSYFNNTEFEAKGLPGTDEKRLLEPFRDQLPCTIFTDAYRVPTTDGSGVARENLIRAQNLLNEAGYVMRDGVRVNKHTGEPLTIEFLMTQRTFERVIAIMRHNLKKLGIDSSFRYVDASQYQKRLEKHEFDVVSIWWNQGLFYPSTEQYLYWHSSQADIEGGNNIGGVKNKAVDTLVEKIQSAQKLEDLRAAARALDRVLTHEFYVIPHWNLSAWRIAYWNNLARPEVTPAYNLGIDTWWSKEVTSDRWPVTGEDHGSRVTSSHLSPARSAP